MRAAIVQVPGGRAVFPDLTVAENLIVGAYTFVWDTVRVEERVEEVLALFPRLRERMGQPAARSRVASSRCSPSPRPSCSRPRLLLIDELSLGLAPIVVEELLAHRGGAQRRRR